MGGSRGGQWRKVWVQTRVREPGQLLQDPAELSPVPLGKPQGQYLRSEA